MSKQRRTEEAIDLFRRHMRGVTRLQQDTVELRPPRRRRHRAQETHIPDVETRKEIAEGPVVISDSPELEFRRPGIQDKIMRKLRRGQLPITAVLDLHGMTIPRAHTALELFMADVRRHPGQCCVQIIHGKGHGSKDRVSVIKQQLQLWLQRNNTVLAYSTCRPADGGTGAMYVLLKNRANTQ